MDLLAKSQAKFLSIIAFYQSISIRTHISFFSFFNFEKKSFRWKIKKFKRTHFFEVLYYYLKIIFIF
jgi:hypothetical protein